MGMFDKMFGRKPKADFSNVNGGHSSTAREVKPETPVISAPQAGTQSTSQNLRTYVVQKGDSLSKIARQFYGDLGKWRQIFEANRDVIGSNPDLIHPGQVLKIPS